MIDKKHELLASHLHGNRIGAWIYHFAENRDEKHVYLYSVAFGEYYFWDAYTRDEEQNITFLSDQTNNSFSFCTYKDVQSTIERLGAASGS